MVDGIIRRITNAVITNPLKNLVVDLLLDEHDSDYFLKAS